VVGASGTALAVAAGPALPVAVLSLAGLASAAMPLGGVDDERLTEASTTLVYALLPFGTVVILDLAFRGVEQFAIGGFPPVAATSPGAELTEFVVLLVVALFGVLVAVREFPAVELAPERDRERIRSVTASVERPLARVTWFAILLVPVAFVVWGTVESGTGPAASLLGTVAPVVGSGFARAALAVAFVGVILLAVGDFSVTDRSVCRAVRSHARQRIPRPPRIVRSSSRGRTPTTAWWRGPTTGGYRRS
jgi:hypothetical protein